eukprot:1611118-Rhodomonas_salina.1
MSTGSTSLSHWGTQAWNKLAGTLARAPAFFIPSEVVPHGSEKGRWWKCTGHSKIKERGAVHFQFAGKWLPSTGDPSDDLTQTQIKALLSAATTTPFT